MFCFVVLYSNYMRSDSDTIQHRILPEYIKKKSFYRLFKLRRCYWTTHSAEILRADKLFYLKLIVLNISLIMSKLLIFSNWNDVLSWPSSRTFRQPWIVKIIKHHWYLEELLWLEIIFTVIDICLHTATK